MIDTAAWSRLRRVVILAALITSAVLPGCSSSGAPTASRTGASVARSTGASASASSGAPISPAPSGSQGAAAPAATAAAIKTAYAKFFASSTPEQVSLGLLQNGPQFKAALDKQAASSLAQHAGAQVSKVTLVSPNVAAVVYAITVNGTPVLKDQPGYAVRQGGIWKVAAKTFCALLTLQGAAPAACTSPAATALPH